MACSLMHNDRTTLTCELSAYTSMPNEITIQPGSQATSPGASANALTPLPGSESISRVWWRPPLAVIREFTESAVAGRNIRMFAVDGNQVVGWCDIFVGEKPGFEHAGSLGLSS